MRDPLVDLTHRAHQPPTLTGASTDSLLNCRAPLSIELGGLYSKHVGDRRLLRKGLWQYLGGHRRRWKEADVIVIVG